MKLGVARRAKVSGFGSAASENWHEAEATDWSRQSSSIGNIPNNTDVISTDYSITILFTVNISYTTSQSTSKHL
jgi:hypothetical protein